MNNARRKELDKAFSMIEEARSIIEAIKDDEQEAFDSMPGGAQEGERGQAMEEAVSALEDADNSLDEALQSIEAAKGQST